MALFGKEKYTLVKVKKKDIPDGLWSKCPECGAPLYTKVLKENWNICSKCDYHLLLTAHERIELLMDEGTFEEHDQNITSVDPLGFKGPKTYKEKLKSDKEKTGLTDAVITGIGALNGKRIALAVTDSRFIMGSMGSVVGERITRVVEYATEHKLPVVIVSGSGGGARMYEGVFSLMQMAKTSALLAVLDRKKIPYISVLTNPTTAGVMASYASLADVIIAEPKALLGFAGPRVIQQTIGQELPENFQSSEFFLEKGFLDMIVNRRELRQTVVKLLHYLRDGK